MYRSSVSLSKTDIIRKEEEQKAKRTEALFSLLPDVFHMTWRHYERESKLLHELIQLCLLNKLNQLRIKKPRRRIRNP